MSDPLRLLSIGAGAIGTYVGGSLALDGNDVVFVERPAVSEKLRVQGLRVDLPGVERHLPDPRIVDSLQEALALHAYDAALFALKSFDTPSFLASLGVPPTRLPPILCLSNGVSNEPALAGSLGADKVIAGTVTSAIGVRGPGSVVLEKLRGVGAARPGPEGGAGGDALARRLVAAMDRAGLNARLFERAADMKWSKLLTNLLANATSAILDMTAREVFADPRLYRLEIRQLRECLDVMAAQGIRAVDLPGTPVRALAFAVKHLPLAVSRPILGRKVGEARGDKMPSFHIDLHAGRGKSEVDYLNGAVVRAGRETGVPTPVNELLTGTLLALTSGDAAIDDYRRNPARLLGTFSKHRIQGQE